MIGAVAGRDGRRRRRSRRPRAPARSPPASPPPSTRGAAPRSPCPAARPARTCSPRSPRPTCRGTTSASGRSTSAWRPTAIPDRNANQLDGVPGRAPPDAGDGARPRRGRRGATPPSCPTASTSSTSAWAPTATRRRGRPAIPVIDSTTAGRPQPAVPGPRPHDADARRGRTRPAARVVLITGADKAPAVAALAGGRRRRRCRSRGCRRRHGRRARPRRGRRAARDDRTTGTAREARRRVLDDAAGAVGDARRADAAAAQRRGPVGDRRALPDRPAVAASPSSPTPTATCASASSCRRAR